MSVVGKDKDQEEAALKWLALAALHGVGNNAKEITIRRNKKGEVRVLAKYRKTELPSPGADVGQKIMSAIREITHIEGTEGKTLLPGDAQRQPGAEGQNQSAGRARESHDRVSQAIRKPCPTNRVLKNKHPAVSRGVRRFGKRSPPTASGVYKTPHASANGRGCLFFNTLLKRGPPGARPLFIPFLFKERETA